MKLFCKYPLIIIITLITISFEVTGQNCNPPVLTQSVICQSGNTQLNASSGYDAYSWSPAAGLSNTNIANPLASINGATYTLTTTSFGPNLFVNYDFSAGNTGFVSSLNYTPSYSPCNYFVAPSYFTLTDPTLIDHTPTTDGMYMSIDGCSAQGTLWEQTIPVINSNTNYNFSFWATRADQVQPIFEVHFIGNVTGDVIVGTYTGIPYAGVWTWDNYGISALWNSGANTSVTVRIINLELNTYGNDFGLDDFTFNTACTASSVITVSVPPPMVLSLPATASFLCGQNSIQISASCSVSNVSYQWSGPSILSGQGTSGISIGAPGSYFLTVTDQTSGCSISSGINVSGSTFPEAGFTTSVSEGESPLYVNFTNTSTNASNYFWDFGNSDSSTQTNPSSIFNEEGTYTVTLIVSDITGNCFDTAQATVVVGWEFSLYVPNAFTPNGDLNNQVFSPKGIGINDSCYALEIFDRWGESIFKSSEFGHGWDATVNGKSTLAQEDVYVWKINVCDPTGKEHHLVGKVTLVR